MILDHRSSARRPKALASLAAIWVALGALYFGWGAAWWVLFPIAVLTLPAFYEAARGDTARLTLDQNRLSWASQRHRGEAPLEDIDHVRFDTRMDFAINARLHLINGLVVRLPIECVPPFDQFCHALDQVGVRHERHHFSFF